MGSVLLTINMSLTIKQYWWVRVVNNKYVTNNQTILVVVNNKYVRVVNNKYVTNNQTILVGSVLLTINMSLTIKQYWWGPCC